MSEKILAYGGVVLLWGVVLYMAYIFNFGKYKSDSLARDDFDFREFVRIMTPAGIGIIASILLLYVSIAIIGWENY